MIFVDQMTLDQEPRRTQNGYMVAMPRVSRIGIQEYLGSEVGRPDMKTVRVYRPESEVFSVDSMHSLAHRPVTVDHPPVMVDATNWKKYSVGQTGGEVARDGDFIRVPMTLMDDRAIRDVEAGKAELSMGYTADLEFTPGTAPDGSQYDAVQKNIRGNHLAIVDSARGGNKLRVIDNSPRGPDMTDKIISIDGISVSVSDTAAQVIAKYTKDSEEKAKDDEGALEAAAEKIAELEAVIAEQVAKIATLEQQLKDAELTPEKLEERVKERAEVSDSARKILPAVIIDGRSVSDIRRQVVDAKLGDTAKGWTDAQVAASYTALASQTSATQAYADSFKGQRPMNDADKSYQAYVDRLNNAYKPAGVK